MWTYPYKAEVPSFDLSQDSNPELVAEVAAQDKRKADRLATINDVYDRVSANNPDLTAARKSALSEEALVAGDGTSDAPEFGSELKSAFKSGMYNLGSMAAGLPAAIVDLGGKQNQFENSGMGILNDWIGGLKNAKIGDGENLASEFLSKMVSAPFKLQDELEKATNSTMDAEQLGKLADETIGIPEEYNPLSPNNIVVKKFEERAKANSALAHKNYTGGIGQAIEDGNYSQAGKLAAIGIVESLPITLGLIAARGAGASEFATLGVGMGVGSAGQTYEQLKEDNPGMDPNLLYANAVLTGAGEAGSELLGTNLIYNQGRRLFTRGATEEAEQVVKKGLKSYVDAAFKKAFVGVAALDEGSTEAVNQIWKNAVDKWSGVKPDVDYTDGAFDAFVIGVGAGATIAAPAHAASKVYNAVNKNAVRAAVTENETIEPFLADPNISDEAKAKLTNQVASNNEKINDVIEEDAAQTAAILNPIENQKATDINATIDEKEAIIRDPEMPAPLKELAQANIVELESQLDDMLVQAQTRKDLVTKLSTDVLSADTPDKLADIIVEATNNVEASNTAEYAALIKTAEQKLADIKSEKPAEGEPSVAETNKHAISYIEAGIANLKAFLPIDKITKETIDVKEETQNAIQEQRPTEEVPRTGTTGEDISGSSERVRPSEQGQEVAGESSPKTNEVAVEEPKQYGYEDIDAMVNPREVADNLYEEITSPTELSPVEQVIREAGGFTTTPESYAQFGDRNNQNDQMAKSYFGKKGMPLDKIAASLSKEGLEVTPADLKDYMERFPDGNTTYSGRAKALQDKLFDMTGKKYNKFTIQKFRDKLAKEAKDKLKSEPGVVTQEAIDLINDEGITSYNVDSFQGQIEFILGDDAFQSIKKYLDGTRTEPSISGTTESTGGEITTTSGESGGLEQQPAGESSTAGTAEPVRDLATVEQDLRVLTANYHDGLKAAGLYELAKEGKAPQEQLNEIKQRVEADFGKTAAELRSEMAALQPSKVVEEEKPVEKKPKVKKKAGTDEMSLADKIRSLKVGRGKAFDSVLGIPVAIYDGALETIATAIEAGTSIAKAIKQAVAYIKANSDEKDDKLIEMDLVKTFEDAGILLKGVQEENVMPDVVEEIEKSPKEISDENIAEFKKRLDKVLSSANTTTLIKTGTASAKLATDAVKAVADISDRKSMLAANRAVKKLFSNIIQNAFISQIKQAREGLKNRLKGSKLAKTDLMKKFLAVKENKLTVEELEEYNTLIRMLNDQYNARMEGVVSDSEIQDFVDKIADKTAKDILDEQITEIEEEQEEVDGEVKESGRRKQLNAAVELNRQELRKGGYDPAYKVVATALLNIDTDLLSNRDMVDLNMALINLAVNDRLTSHEKIFKKYTGITGFKTLEDKVGDNIRGLLESSIAAAARSLDVNSKIIFKGIKDAVSFQSASGLSGISNGNSQVANIDMKCLDKNYKSFIERLKFPNYNNSDNRFLRGMYSAVTQFNSIESEAKDFLRYKSLVKQSADKLLSSKIPSEQREGRLREEQYNTYLAPFEDRVSFEDNFNQTQAKNVKVVEFFREQFDNRLPEMKLNTLIYGGKNLKVVNNYLPMPWKKYSGTKIQKEIEMEDIVNPIYDFDPETGDISERQSSTTIERTNKSKIKDSDRILNMDFDRFIFDKYREMNYDVRTLKNRHLYNSIKDQDGFTELVGSPKNEDVLNSGVKSMVKRQLGQGYTNTDIKPLIDASRVLSAKGVRQALFGVSQVIKQYPSVAVRTMINLNSDVGLFFKGVNVGNSNPIFDNFGIGLRGSIKGGTVYELELNKISKSDFSSSPAKLLHTVNRAAKNVTDQLSKPLSWSDESVAKHSWIAYYLQYIKQNGGDIDKIDWETEHLNPNNEAGSYADLMVSTTQAPSDSSKQANLLYDQGDAKTILRDVIAPFTSFARNSQANLEADLRTFAGGTTSEKKAAAWGIISNITEQVTFNSIKVLLIAAMIKSGSQFVQGLFFDEPPEDEKKGNDGAAAKIIKNSTADILFGGLGQLASYWAIKGVNQANKAAMDTSKDLFYQYDPAKFGDPDFGIAGIYGILPQNVYNAIQKLDYVNGTLTENYTQKKKEYKATVQLSANDQYLVSMLFFMDALAIAGISDAELSRLNQTIFRDIKKRTSPVKKYTIEYLNKKSGATKEEVPNE